MFSLSATVNHKTKSKTQNKQQIRQKKCDQLLLDMVPTLECSWYARYVYCILHWKKWFSLCQRHQLQIASWLRVVLYAHFPFCYVLEFCMVWIYAGLTYAVTVSLSSYVHSASVFGRHCFLGAIHHPWLLKSFHLLLHRTLDLEGKALWSYLI